MTLIIAHKNIFTYYFSMYNNIYKRAHTQNNNNKLFKKLIFLLQIHL